GVAAAQLTGVHAGDRDDRARGEGHGGDREAETARGGRPGPLEERLERRRDRGRRLRGDLTDQRDGDGGREEHRGRHVQGEAGAGAAAERRVRDERDDGEQRRGGQRRTEQDAVRRPAGG